jgi:hypothetical protein
MESDERQKLVIDLMDTFVRLTGAKPGGGNPRRYLWTDAFAVCNFLELHRLTGEERFIEQAICLVDQVHEVLGRHRSDDERKGWISGLPEEEGREHPTAGGLRIGKLGKERTAAEPLTPGEEWERDGQYIHYLTKWMHALARVSEAANDPKYLRWAIELADVAQRRFSYMAPSGERRMYWKMSIDLSRPLVPMMGQHDALDALITYRELVLAEQRFPEERFPDLGPAMDDASSMCRIGSWATDDPLGIGSLLDCAWWAALMDDGSGVGLLRRIAAAAVVSLGALGSLDGEMPASRRLAFRELGLSIGLHALESLNDRIDRDKADGLLLDQIEVLRSYSPLGRRTESFWTDPRNRRNPMWAEHEEINSVMLATSLMPGGFLELWVPPDRTAVVKRAP